MLLELRVRNFGIIEQAALRFADGFTVLTGETGAGKSLIVDAIGALLGARVGADFVRHGASSAELEAIFALPESLGDAGEGDGLAALLDEYGVGREGSLILSRDIQRGGRSISRIDGRALPQSVVQQIGRHLVDIHGQTDHVSLLRPAEHIEFLDRYAGLQPLRARVAEAVGRLRQTRRELAASQQDEREVARRLDLLRFQVDEIAAASLQPGEDETLASEQRRLANAEKIGLLTSQVFALLFEGEDDASAASDQLSRAQRLLADLTRLDESAGEWAAAVETLIYQLEDINRGLRDYRLSSEADPERQAEVEERLSLISNLKRKYGATIDDVLAFAERAQQELDELDRREERTAELLAQEQALLDEVGRLAGELSAARHGVIENLARAIEAELKDLNMERVRFAVEIAHTPDPDGVRLEPDGERLAFDSRGVDRVEFYVATNPGEPAKPLAKVASGGETSRLMLALKSVLSRVDQVPTLIFDEVDAGVGGRSGIVVGEKLWGLTGGHQVICVSHLPQIAAYGDAHYHVAKNVVGERTTTGIRPLAGDDRVSEIAQMMGGMTDAGQDTAQELLRRAARWKEARCVRDTSQAAS